MTRERSLRLTAWGEGPGEGLHDLHRSVIVRRVFHDAPSDRDYLVVDQDMESAGSVMSAVITPRGSARWTWPSGDEVQYVDVWEVTGDERYVSDDLRGLVPPGWTSSLYVIHDGGSRPHRPGWLARLSDRGVDRVLVRIDALCRKKR